jgi:hypothetical protein
MGNKFVEAIERAVAKVVEDFQDYPSRFWNERDIHWSLFYYLQQAQVVRETYPTELIRAEFPTLKVFPGNKPARGHYDLVIINSESYNKPEVQSMNAQTSWEVYPKLIKIDVAIEIKLWLNRSKQKAMEERVDWDIKKLVEPQNNVVNAFFLNFVQLDFSRKHNRVYYETLRDYLVFQKRQCQELRILCAASDSKIQPQSTDNWISSP